MSENLLSNLKELYEDLKRNDWTITSYLFTFKNIEYIVLVKRFTGSTVRVNKYALVKLCFMKFNNLDDNYELEANSVKLIIEDIKGFRDFFNLHEGLIYKNLIYEFTKSLGRATPKKMKVNITNKEKSAIIKSLSISDSENPNRIYCYKIRRNPIGSKRSEFNSDKTKLLRPSLYEILKDDKSISFCYSDDPIEEKEDKQILANINKK